MGRVPGVVERWEPFDDGEEMREELKGVPTKGLKADPRSGLRRRARGAGAGRGDEEEEDPELVEMMRKVAEMEAEAVAFEAHAGCRGEEAAPPTGASRRRLLAGERCG